MESSLRLFHAIADCDYDALLELYGKAAVDALVQYRPPLNRSDSAREEKVDEFFAVLSRNPVNQNFPIRKFINKQHHSQSHGCAELLRHLTIFLNHPDMNQSSDDKHPVTAAADRLVRETVSILSEMRPPANFMIYSGGRVVLSDNDTRDTDTPPIFDGAVAISTPGISAGHGGGFGTSMHAAVALDRPLILAFLLAMGVDGRACHTAFRRLVMHEAACDGSIKCLRLLLEVGHRFGKQMASQQQYLQSPTAVPQRSPESVRDFAYFPRRTIYHSAKPFLPINSISKHAFVDENVPRNDVLSMLRLFRTCYRRVQTNQQSELDAARCLLRAAALSESTQQALAKMCGYAVPSAVAITLMRSTYLTQNSTNSVDNSSDGHGNSPLHWASFKNEASAVQLLLEFGADPNARALPSGWTPLHDAAYSNGREAIELLVAAGATVDSRAHSGATPLCFAAQEDSADAAELLLQRGADLCARCSSSSITSLQPDPNTGGTSRFSGYTPLHYCAHYNAHKAAAVLLRHKYAKKAMEIFDLNNRLPIHVAVARGSSDVLRELLRAGARVETRSRISRHHSQSPSRCMTSISSLSLSARSAPASPMRGIFPTSTLSTPPRARGRSDSAESYTSVSSPALRLMIPTQPVQSSKPWNCLSQRSIDECRNLIQTVEENWAPDRHSLFTPADRRAVAELLRVGKRLELDGSLQFKYLWPEVLSFCGRGWFEVDDSSYTNDETESDSLDANDEENDSLALPVLL